MFHYCVNSGKQAERPRELSWILAHKKVASEKGLLMGEWLISFHREGDLVTARLYQFSSVTQWCPTLFNPMDCTIPGLPVHHQLPEFTQTHVHWVSDAIQPSHPLLAPSPPTPNPSQHQGLFQGVSSSQQVAKVLEFQLQHQSFQWIFRTDFL